MEQLLNLAWLLLALPAYWLWRSSRYARTGQLLTSLQCLLSLACMLLILFPVVSATDDLHVMRAEMEESQTGKRSIGQSSDERQSVPKSQAQPALPVSARAAVALEHGTLLVVQSSVSTPASPVSIRSGRAPPHDSKA